MKNITWYWNLLHYNLFIWYQNAHKIFNYINPFSHLFKIPFVKKFYAKNGVDDMKQHIETRIFHDKEKGINSVWAGIQIGGLFVIIEYGIFNIIQGLIGKSLIHTIWEDNIFAIVFVILLVGIAGLFNYFALFKSDKYLIYFDEFEKWPKIKRVNYGWGCVMAVVLIIIFLIISFYFVPN